MAIVISGNGIDMGNTSVSNASQIDGVVINENGDNVATTSNLVGFKNYIINGGFDVWQRGTSNVINSSKPNDFTADRWLTTQQFATGALTVSKSSLVYNGVTYTSQKVLTTTPVVISGSTQCMPFYYKIEGNNAYSLNGSNFTLSFIFKTNVAGTYTVAFTTSSDGVGPNNTYVTTFNAISGTQKITINVPSCNTIGKTDGYGLRIIIGAFASSGAYTTSTLNTWISNSSSNSITHLEGALNWATSTNNYLEIAQVQLEEGSVATPFENRPIGLELSLCQRYYCRVRVTPTPNSVWLYTFLPVPMRVAPTIALVDGGGVKWCILW